MSVRQQFELISLLIKHEKIIKNNFDMILYVFWIIKKVKLFDSEIFLKIDVKIIDEISDSIKIDYDDIHFFTENSYIMNWSIEFFWIFEKNENITSINTLHFWSKSTQIFSL